MRTGFAGGQGPRTERVISKMNQPLDLDSYSLEDAVKKSISTATWLEEADLGAAVQAVQLANTMDTMPDRRHQIAPILIGLLGNLGLLNNRKEDKSLSPEEMLNVIAMGA